MSSIVALDSEANPVDFSTITSYPAPHASIIARPIFPTRPLLPVNPPPMALTSANLPDLPSPERDSTNEPFIVTSHIIPAAWPRSTPFVQIPFTGDYCGAKEGKKQAAEEMQTYLDKVRAETTASRTEEHRFQGREALLWISANRYIKKGAYRTGSGLTLLFVHGNGFNKETWDATIRYIFESTSHFDIAEVWSYEAVQTGDSALLNKGKVGAVYDCRDNSRDIVNFLNNFLAESPLKTPPTHLPQVSAAESDYRKKYGFKNRKLVGIGHSFGGLTMTLAALINPALFSSLINVDATIVSPLCYELTKNTYVPDTALGILLRRDRWGSREEAKALMLKSPFFASWHPDVLQSYVDYGLYAQSIPSSPGGEKVAKQQVLLKMPAVEEAATFADVTTFYEVWEMMKVVDERIPMFWIMPKPETTAFGGPVEAQIRVWRRRKNTSNVIINTDGHFVPQQAPGECADAIMGFLHKQYYSSKAKL
ncbi:hypothetical protein PC9H_011071 [Pleurotus ostreatus]|uniref:AB hydrolase-1 domain-containing protein n=2 Tax=Pleurotus ostreatus TaxID=5322 RepID=A0A067NBH1_PLEO1|nr:uncharacterized protein PC9H_011071 [Pleurotus ostreatus]KAF7422907.1 hypothetical protein PC9H_011071 [Pleurotus ostreatus]KAJ8691124.1 hypothetical protein PTI98_010722 [Pleurotus ostreatus]KDQ25353.1 hypothetical protein PLEOSDRAFT_1113415 [Pleurotus ostreatus PC15]